MKELEIDAVTGNLGAVLEFIAEETRGSPESNKVLIAAEEIFVNIANYAYNSDIGKVRVRVAGDVAIEFEDCGVPFDPLQKADPDIALSAEERDIGGLGVFMAKTLMDDISYRREGGKNILTIKKKICKSE
jgi:anti-sigma regulatory factor (Ser/Thr protein kinase)